MNWLQEYLLRVVDGNAGSGVELTQIAMLGSLAECGMILTISQISTR